MFYPHKLITACDPTATQVRPSREARLIEGERSAINLHTAARDALDAVVSTSRRCL